MGSQQGRRRLLVSLSLGGILEMTSALIKLIVGIALIVIAIAIGPILGIWSLNTLFPVLQIPLTWETWAAFAILFGSSIATRLKK
jgi:hypothetical protein